MPPQSRSEIQQALRLAGRTSRALYAAGKVVARELAAAEQERRAAAAATAAPAPVALPPLSVWARLATSLIYYGLPFALVATVLVVFNIDFLLGRGRTAAIVHLACGGVLIYEGLFLANTRGSRLLVRRLLERQLRRRGTTLTSVRVWPARLLGPLFTLLGIVWLGAGTYQLVRGVASFV